MSSALILAGGKGSRLGYREKALIDINGTPLIKFVIKSLEKVVDNIIISVRDKAQGELLSSSIDKYVFVYDKYKNKGPLSGILSGLLECKDECCFIVACDMPFINPEIVKMLFEKIENFDVAIPRWSDGSLEPLHAVYKCKAMIRETQSSIDKGENIILAPIFRLNVNFVAINEIRKIEPELKTFININTYDELARSSKNVL